MRSENRPDVTGEEVDSLFSQAVKNGTLFAFLSEESHRSGIGYHSGFPLENALEGEPTPVDFVLIPAFENTPSTDFLNRPEFVQSVVEIDFRLFMRKVQRWRFGSHA